jgi:hypothetical protein
MIKSSTIKRVVKYASLDRGKKIDTYIFGMNREYETDVSRRGLNSVEFLCNVKRVWRTSGIRHDLDKKVRQFWFSYLFINTLLFYFSSIHLNF